jgi:hypothetical protein
MTDLTTTIVLNALLWWIMLLLWVARAGEAEGEAEMSMMLKKIDQRGGQDRRNPPQRRRGCAVGKHEWYAGAGLTGAINCPEHDGLPYSDGPNQYGHRAA